MVLSSFAFFFFYLIWQAISLEWNGLHKSNNNTCVGMPCAQYNQQQKYDVIAIMIIENIWNYGAWLSRREHSSNKYTLERYTDSHVSNWVGCCLDSKEELNTPTLKTFLIIFVQIFCIIFALNCLQRKKLTKQKWQFFLPIFEEKKIIKDLITFG